MGALQDCKSTIAQQNPREAVAEVIPEIHGGHVFEQLTKIHLRNDPRMTLARQAQPERPDTRGQLMKHRHRLDRTRQI